MRQLKTLKFYKYLKHEIVKRLPERNIKFSFSSETKDLLDLQNLLDIEMHEIQRLVLAPFFDNLPKKTLEVGLETYELGMN